MSTKQQIFDFIESSGQVTSGAIASHFKISRETVLDKIRLMENEGIVYRGNQLRIGGVLWSIKKTKTKNEIVFDVLEKYGTMKKTAISAMCGISKRNIEEILKNLYSTGLISIEKKLQNGRTINFYSIKNKLAEIQFPQDKPAVKKIPQHPLSYLFKGSPWQGAENFMGADPNK